MERKLIVIALKKDTLKPENYFRCLVTLFKKKYRMLLNKVNNNEIN